MRQTSSRRDVSAQSSKLLDDDGTPTSLYDRQYYWVGKNRRYQPAQPKGPDTTDPTLGLILSRALSVLDYIDQPCHYVVEERPKHVPEHRQPGKAKTTRFDDRERWILLDPEEVKHKFTERVDRGGTHAGPVPHLRRAHNRTLTSERWTFKRGSTIYVRPTWIGDREWQGKGARYKVISRVGASETQA